MLNTEIQATEPSASGEKDFFKYFLCTSMAQNQDQGSSDLPLTSWCIGAIIFPF